MNGIGNEMWIQGFSDGYAGIPHVDGKGEDYDNGYSRGYSTVQVQDEITLHEPQTKRMQLW